MLHSAYVSPLTVEDIPALEKLEEEIHLSFWGKENYRRFLEDFPEYFGSRAAIVTNSGSSKLLGFYLARSLFENLEILKVGVLAEYQRRGIGTLLMESAYAEGIKRGCRRCFLEVRKSNFVAMEFYHRHKFRVAGSRLGYYSDPVEDAWVMERSL